MAWLESHQSLLTHRKTLRLAALLKANKYQVIGHLHALWWWSLDNASDNGSLGEALAEEIAEASGWPQRSANLWLDSLVSVQFLDQDGAALVLHNWDRYAGKLNRARAANRQRMKDARATHVQDTDAERVGLPTSPHLTSPTQPTGISLNGSGPNNRSALRSVLNLSPSDVETIRKKYPNADINGRWNEWVSWIEEEEGVRSPKSGRVVAFMGWLKRNDGSAQSSVALGRVKV